MTNLITNSGLGLLFFIPGFDETLRVNGTAEITNDQSYCDLFMRDSKPALSVLKVDVQQAYFHCGKSLKRSRLWDNHLHRDRTTFPSHGRIIAEQTKSVTRAESEEYVAKSYRERLY